MVSKVLQNESAISAEDEAPTEFWASNSTSYVQKGSRITLFFLLLCGFRRLNVEMDDSHTLNSTLIDSSRRIEAVVEPCKL